MDPSNINIIRQITCSDSSAIFEVDLDGQKYAFKLFHDNGDPGYTKKGRDLNRFRCELNAYKKLLTAGVCARGFVPKFHGDINRMDPAAFHPALQAFARDKLKPRAILLEYFPHAESLNCVTYSDALYPQAIEEMHEIHQAGVHHQDIYPKNRLLVRGDPDRLVWIDCDVATTFTDLGPEQLARCDYEIALVRGLAEALRDDQTEGLPPKYEILWRVLDGQSTLPLSFCGKHCDFSRGIRDHRGSEGGCCIAAWRFRGSANAKAGM